MGKSMNLVDALKSGKRIKRPGWEVWAYAPSLMFSKESVLADDWEVEPDPDPEPKLKAWSSRAGTVCMFDDGVEDPLWKRAEWLDQP